MGTARLVAILGLLIISGPSRADESERLVTEAAALFRVVMAGERSPKPCQYPLDWTTMPIPAYVANKHFGLTLHADLSAPFQTTAFQHTLDPQNQHGKAFCSAAETIAYEKAAFEAFEKDSSVKEVRVERTGFALPVFDADFRKAIVIVSRSSLDRSRIEFQMGSLKPGGIIRHPAESIDVANVYTRNGNRWTSLASEVIGRS